MVFLCSVIATAITVVGKSTVAGKVDDETVVRSVGRNIDLSSVNNKWVNLPGLRSGGAHRRAVAVLWHCVFLSTSTERILTPALVKNAEGAQVQEVSSGVRVPRVPVEMA